MVHAKPVDVMMAKDLEEYMDSLTVVIDSG